MRSYLTIGTTKFCPFSLVSTAFVALLKTGKVCFLILLKHDTISEIFSYNNYFQRNISMA